MTRRHQKLPASGPKREALRERGQFWTPDWVAEAMVAYVLAGASKSVFDPAVGGGAFLRAAKALEKHIGRRINLLGTELDAEALRQARESGLSERDLSRVEMRDFVLHPPRGPFSAIVANPPYIRHHRIPASTKNELRALGVRLLGRALDGRAGLHVYFLLRALHLLDPEGGRLAFIMPADTCEGIFAPRLWQWITSHYCLDAVVTFDAQASPFPGVDTNAIIFMIRSSITTRHFLWARCTQAGTDELKRWTLSNFSYRPKPDLMVLRRELAEALTTGLSRPPAEGPVSGTLLAEFATALRGIATGDNEFFFLTATQAQSLGIPRKFLVSAVGRTRDVVGDEITQRTLDGLEAAGRPTLLFCPDGRSKSVFPESVRRYLGEGERRGLHQRPLIASRSPWYKMEVRKVPPILFAYLGRRSARFIRNLAGVVPLTGFLCIYPRSPASGFIDKLWRVLSHPETIANLSLVGKSYGSGAIKVEPRALERLPLPDAVVAEAGLEPPLRSVQPALPFSVEIPGAGMTTSWPSSRL